MIIWEHINFDVLLHGVLNGNEEPESVQRLSTIPTLHSLLMRNKRLDEVEKKMCKILVIGTRMNRNPVIVKIGERETKM